MKYELITGSTRERSQRILDIVGIDKEIVAPQPVKVELAE